MNSVKEVVETYIVADRSEKSAKEMKDSVKADIISSAKEIIPAGTKTVQLEGMTGSVNVTFKESLSIAPNAEFMQAYNSGKYTNIKKTIGIGVLPEHSDAVISALMKAGLAGVVTITEGYEFDSKSKTASKDLDPVLKAATVIKETPSITVVK